MDKATDEMYQKASGQADEIIAEKSNKRTGPQINVGPDMGREDKAAKKYIEKEADKYLGTTKSNVSSAVDAYKKGADRAKMNAQEFKKGGKTTAKCMARGGGIEIRGKTKGRFV